MDWNERDLAQLSPPPAPRLFLFFLYPIITLVKSKAPGHHLRGDRWGQICDGSQSQYHIPFPSISICSEGALFWVSLELSGLA